MNKKIWRTAQVLAVLQLLAALALHGVYTRQWSLLTTDQVMPFLDKAVSIAALLFILLPIAAVLGLFRYSRWGYYPLIAFPLVAIVFGTIPIPYASHFFGSDIKFMSNIVVAVNVVLVSVGVVLFKYSKATVEVSQ